MSKQAVKSESYLAPFNPTDKGAISQVVKLANFLGTDVLCDLGCGDGRVLINAVKKSPLQRAIGVEYDEVYYKRAKEAVAKEGLERQISIIFGDANVVDTSEVTVFFVYLVPEGLKKIRPKVIDALTQNPGCRVLSNIFSIPDLVPTAVFRYSRANLKLFLYDAQSVRVGSKAFFEFSRRYVSVVVAALFVSVSWLSSR